MIGAMRGFLPVFVGVVMVFGTGCTARSEIDKTAVSIAAERPEPKRMQSVAKRDTIRATAERVGYEPDPERIGRGCGCVFLCSRHRTGRVLGRFHGGRYLLWRLPGLAPQDEYVPQVVRTQDRENSHRIRSARCVVQARQGVMARLRHGRVAAVSNLPLGRPRVDGRDEGRRGLRVTI